MYSFLPVAEDRAGAIITLVGLGHERKGYVERSVDSRVWYSSQLCQIDYYFHLHPCLSFPMRYDCSVSVRCCVAAFKQQNHGAFYLSEQDVSTTNFEHMPHDRQHSLY